MISRSRRLSARQLESVLQKGRALHSPLFILRLAEAAGLSRLAASVPVKAARKAVDRNRGRRLMYDAAQGLMSKLKDGFHIVIFAKKNLADSKEDISAAIAADMESLFVKAGVLK